MAVFMPPTVFFGVVESSVSLIINPMEPKGCCLSAYRRVLGASLSGMAGGRGETDVPRLRSPNIFFTFSTIWSGSKSPTTTTAWF